MPSISIIAPSLNHSKYIEKFINSLLNQTYTDFELIIIDDGSIDNSKDIVKQFVDNRIIFIENDYNMGINATLYKGITFSTTDNIVFAGTDDYFHKDFLLYTKNKFNEGFDVIYHSYIAVDDNNTTLLEYSHTLKNENKYNILYKLFFNNCLSSPGMAFKKSLFLKYCTLPAGYFLVSDYHLHIQLLLNCSNLFIFEEPYVFYRKLKNSASHSEFTNYRISIEREYIFNAFEEITDFALFKKIFSSLSFNDNITLDNVDFIPFYLSYIAIYSDNLSLSEIGYKKLLQFYSINDNNLKLYNAYHFQFKDLINLVKKPYSMINEVAYKNKIERLRRQRKLLIYSLSFIFILFIIFLFWFV